jgi:TRAP-type C4-dicarboxylate transport system permease large subunit
VPQKTGELMKQLSGTEPWVIFLMSTCCCSCSAPSSTWRPTILICTPIFLPICQQFGMDPLQFGVMMLINCALGLNTPPVGTTQFVGCAIGEGALGRD